MSDDDDERRRRNQENTAASSSRVEGPFCIVSDDDCHRYVIPVARRADWEAFLRSDAAADGDAPAWADRIDGESSISFHSYEPLR
jgi:hypothetical protein